MRQPGGPNRCPQCGGTKEAGSTTFTVDFGEGLVVVRGVPATVCPQCGAEWIDDETAAKLETIVSDARRKNSVIEVTRMSA